MELPTVSMREFARLVGVDPSAVSRAAKAGKRLTSMSVVRDKNGDPRIVVLHGCHEWLQYKDERRERAFRSGSASSIEGIMSRDTATEVDRHYSALMKQLEYGRACQELLPVSKYLQEASDALRACRDTLSNLPLLLSELARPILKRLLRMDVDVIGPEEQKRMDDAILQLRVAAKREVRRALNQAADMIESKDKREAERRSNEEALHAV